MLTLDLFVAVINGIFNLVFLVGLINPQTRLPWTTNMIYVIGLLIETVVFGYYGLYLTALVTIVGIGCYWWWLALLYRRI